MTFPSAIAIKFIDAKASEYDQFSITYATAADLYKGGQVLRDAVLKRGLYLLQKPKEMREVFATRQQRFMYTNLLGNILGWYGAALFKIAAQIVRKKAGTAPPHVVKPGDPVVPVLPPPISPEAEDFCTAFEKDCDGAGTTYCDFWRKGFEGMVLNKAAYVLIDLPTPDPNAPKPVNLLQQSAAGLLDPFLVLYQPSQVINWETDRYGNLTWCIVTVMVEEREAFKKPVIRDYWYYFDAQQVACYSAVRKEGKHGDEDLASLETGYPRAHAMTALNRIPIRKIEVPEGLWLANRVYLPLLNHLNLDNAYDFALFQSALAQLVISGDFDDFVAMTEVGYLKLPTATKAEYLEPEGRAYKAIDDRLQALEERIYKACYLMDQARTNRSTPTAQSGISKQQDKTPSRDALSGLGDVIRPAMQLVYSDVLEIRGLTDVSIDVRGFDYQDKAGVEDMDTLEKSTIIDIQSDTFKRERDMKMTRLVLPDLNPETQTQIDAEIRSNPTPEEAAAAAAALQQEQEAATQLATFNQSFKQGEGTSA